jgi:protein-tyrosine phosphatase
MIDLHCHILPGLDDGALDLRDSMAMARQAHSDGIAAVCATPHIRHDHEVTIEKLGAHVRSLQSALDDGGIELRILPGGEVAETEADRLSDAQLHAVSLGGAGGWVLIEPAPGPLGDRLYGVVARLTQRGLGAVIAHPERHAGADFIERLTRLASAGCLIQWTAEFIAQATPGEYVLGLASQGLVHLLGSDAHSSHGGRPVHLAAGFASLAHARTAEQIEWSAQLAPRAIVSGDRTLRAPPSW